MDDDFNTPILVAHLFDAAKFIQAVQSGKETISAADREKLSEALNAFVFDILGLTEISEDNSDNGSLDTVMELVLQMRQQARENKDWTTAEIGRASCRERL